MPTYLTADAVAREYSRTNLKRFDSAQALVDSIDNHLAQHGLADSKVNRYEIAQEVLRLQRDERLATAEAADFERNLREGTTADDAALRQMDQLALAGQVANMSAAEFSQNRARFGLERTTADFLLGH
jgi:hypothetical protein